MSWGAERKQTWKQESFVDVWERSVLEKYFQSFSITDPFQPPVHILLVSAAGAALLFVLITPFQLSVNLTGVRSRS